jgi:hypothetical protein
MTGILLSANGCLLQDSGLLLHSVRARDRAPGRQSSALT